MYRKRTNGYFDRWRRNRDYRRNLQDWIKKFQTDFHADLSNVPSRTVITKGRAIGMSSHYHATLGDYWIVDDGTGLHVKTCARCGYTWNWKDYTKFQFRMPNREFKRRIQRCVRCNCQVWNKRRLENQFDEAIARMVGELN